MADAVFETYTPDGHMQFGRPYKNFVLVGKGSMPSSGTINVMGASLPKSSITVSGYAPLIGVSGADVVAISVSFSGSSWTFDFINFSGGGTYYVFDEMPPVPGGGLELYADDHTTLLWSPTRNPIRPEVVESFFDDLSATLGVYAGSPQTYTYDPAKTYAVIPLSWTTDNTEPSDVDGYTEYHMPAYRGNVGSCTASAQFIRDRVVSSGFAGGSIDGAFMVMDVTNY